MSIKVYFLIIIHSPPNPDSSSLISTSVPNVNRTWPSTVIYNPSTTITTFAPEFVHDVAESKLIQDIYFSSLNHSIAKLSQFYFRSSLTSSTKRRRPVQIIYEDDYDYVDQLSSPNDDYDHRISANIKPYRASRPRFSSARPRHGSGQRYLSDPKRWLFHPNEFWSYFGINCLLVLGFLTATGL